MRLKSYLRGLGIGIIVTALLLHFTNSNLASDTQKDMAKADINIEDSIDDVSANEESINDISANEDSTYIEDNIDNSSLNEDSNEDNKDNNVEEIQNIEIETFVEAKPEENKEPLQDDDEISKRLETISKTLEEAAVENVSVSADSENSGVEFSLTIVKGDDSGTVARKLYNAGLVDNAAQFDAYLMQHGYDKRISVGTVKIKEGATWNEIAQKISGN